MFFIKSADAQDVLYLALHIIHAALPVMADGCMADFLHSLGNSDAGQALNASTISNSSLPSSPSLPAMASMTLWRIYTDWQWTL